MPSLLRLRALPWLVLFEAARAVHSHVGEHLSASDRHRVAEIVKGAKGDPRRVSARERNDLKAIARKLDLASLGRELVPTIGRAAVGRGRRRR
jgi:hypothetical protein